ncbi:MAG: class I SAM-dependent methyltransferase [Patescibacteria group bacterium]
MVVYNLSHLTQANDQSKPGPIQDDEALLLFALIRVTRIKRILELGAGNGYSAVNFCAAIGSNGKVYSVDWGIDASCPKIADNHIVIVKNVADLNAKDLDEEPIDLVFFDCHAYEAELCAFQSLRKSGIITDKTIFVFHDTNLWPTKDAPNLLKKKWPEISYEVEGGWVFGPPERQLVNDFKEMGYDIFNLGTKRDVHGTHLPYRCGLSIASKFAPFELKFGATAPWMAPQDRESAQFIKIGQFDYVRKSDKNKKE